MSERPPCLCESYARVTERAALAGARWLGRADVEGAEEATFSAMRGVARRAADQRAHRRSARPRAKGCSPVGERPSAQAARRPTSRSTRSKVAASSRAADTGAMSMIAVGEPGSLLTLPDMYMRKMAVGPRARGSHRPQQADRGEHQGDRRRVRPERERHHDDRARPSAPPRPDRGDPRVPARASS